MLYHAGFSWFSGGYIGVDVFFVISGFLITTIILDERFAGIYSIQGFYERRARRILPALFLVMLVCIPCAWLWMLPNELKRFAQSLVGVALFVSNVVFFRTSGYFDVDATEKPLLHTWSLGVEEQYYAAFPLLIGLLWPLRIWRMALVVTALALLSYLLCEWELQRNAVASFFLAPTRAWELLSGSLLAFAIFSKGPKLRQWVGVGAVLGVVGLLLIVVPIFVFGESTRFPGRNALPPVVGTVLVIAFAWPETWVGRMLSQRPLLWVGTISYSAYLWHQPLLAFARLTSANERPKWVLGLMLCMSLLLAAMSQRFVEAPFRDRGRFSRKTIFCTAILASLVFVGIGSALIVGDGVPRRWNATTRSLLMPSKTTIDGCPAINSWLQVCRIGAPGIPPTIALVGDSHADALASALGESLARYGRAAYLIHTPCHPISGFFDSRETATPRAIAFCAEANQRLLALVSQPAITSIIVAVRWTLRLYPMGDEIGSPGFDNGEGGIEHIPFRTNLAIDARGHLTNDANVKAETVIAYLRGLAALKPVLLIYPVPEVGWVPERVNLAAVARGGMPPDLISTSWTRFKSRNATAERLLDSDIAQNIQRVHPEKVLCNGPVKQRCVVQDHGQLYYYDDNHLSTAGAQLVINAVVRALGLIN